MFGEDAAILRCDFVSPKTVRNELEDLFHRQMHRLCLPQSPVIEQLPMRGTEIGITFLDKAVQTCPSTQSDIQQCLRRQSSKRSKHWLVSVDVKDSIQRSKPLHLLEWVGWKSSDNIWQWRQVLISKVVQDLCLEYRNRIVVCWSILQRKQASRWIW